MSMKNIIFTGLPYSGKTTVSKKLSEILKWPLINLDEEIEKRAGLSITTIFEKYGENTFRKLEAQIIDELPLDNHIIDCGGGSIIHHGNSLKNKGAIIYLKRNIKLVELDNTRPLIKNYDDLKRLKNERENIYYKYADYYIENNQTIENCITKIRKELRL